MILNMNLVSGNNANSSIETNYQASRIIGTVKFFPKKTKILLARKCYGNSFSNSILTKIKP